MSLNTNAPVVTGKSPIVAYVLWFFLGSLGVHRFYLDSNKFGAIQLALAVVGWLTVIFFIGGLFLSILGIWLLFDLVWIAIRTGLVGPTPFDGVAARLT